MATSSVAAAPTIAIHRVLRSDIAPPPRALGVRAREMRPIVPPTSAEVIRGIPAHDRGLPSMSGRRVRPSVAFVSREGGGIRSARSRRSGRHEPVEGNWDRGLGPRNGVIMLRKLLFLSTVVVALAMTTPASATKPIRESGPQGETVINDQCAFPVLGHIDGVEVIKTWLDDAGNPVKQIVTFPGTGSRSPTWIRGCRSRSWGPGPRNSGLLQTVRPPPGRWVTGRSSRTQSPESRGSGT